jgi:hypothetical protein
MTAIELEDVLSFVPPDTPVVFQIEGVEAHCSSANVEHETFIFPARGNLVPITEPKVAHILLEVRYGSE